MLLAESGGVGRSLYPRHGRGLRNGAEACAEQGLDLCEVVGRAESREIALADDGQISLHLGVADDNVELLGDFVELLEFFAKGVRFLFDRSVEHIDRCAVLAGGPGSRDVLQGPLLCEAFVGALTV